MWAGHAEAKQTPRTRTASAPKFRGWRGSRSPIRSKQPAWPVCRAARGPPPLDLTALGRPPGPPRRRAGRHANGPDGRRTEPNDQLLPGIREDYGPDTVPSSPRVLAFFLGALTLISSLGGTAVLLSRAGSGHSRSLGLWLSAVRPGLITLAVTVFIAYGINTVEFA
ncbi:hypothetical protein GCM10010286_64230 [Streptomyces toxytricini]|nr:hypothetical protein GCM10010286_64230 [Streptomyces toxytricini]